MAKTKHDRLPYVTGEKGVNRVRLYAHFKTGILWLDCRAPERIRQSLGHRDVTRGKQAAEQLAAALRTKEAPRSPDVTLKTLFDMYEREVTPTKSPGKQAHDRRTRALFERCWGSTTKVKDLDRRDWDRFIVQRRSGALRPPGGYHSGGVRDRQIELDLRFMLAVIHWGEGVRERGHVLVVRNPFFGLAVPSELNPQRPRLNDGEYGRLQESARVLGPSVELFLVLAHETGHRSNAIRQLQWSDVDFELADVRWRAETDKTGREHVTPLSPTAMRALCAERQRVPTVGHVWIFPAPGTPGEAVSRHLVRDWWRKLERRAGLPPERGRGWHSVRRKFASDLDAIGASHSDVMALGGWRNIATLTRCYITPDRVRLRAALEQRGRASPQPQRDMEATG